MQTAKRMRWVIGVVLGLGSLTGAIAARAAEFAVTPVPADAFTAAPVPTDVFVTPSASLVERYGVLRDADAPRGALGLLAPRGLPLGRSLSLRLGRLPRPEAARLAGERDALRVGLTLDWRPRR